MRGLGRWRASAASRDPAECQEAVFTRPRPKAEIGFPYSITSSVRARSSSGTARPGVSIPPFPGFAFTNRYSAK